MQIPRNGRPDADGVEHGRLETARAQRVEARPEGADAREHDGDGIGDHRGSAVSRASAPRRDNAFCAECRFPMP